MVLIDTWWNVNTSGRLLRGMHGIVLIDTWWNVNVLPKTFAKIFDGFNRYMVECESWNHELENPVGWVLIDTWWNVN